jgi:hypothetical protein
MCDGVAGAAALTHQCARRGTRSNAGDCSLEERNHGKRPVPGGPGLFPICPQGKLATTIKI